MVSVGWRSIGRGRWCRDADDSSVAGSFPRFRSPAAGAAVRVAVSAGESTVAQVGSV